MVSIVKHRRRPAGGAAGAPATMQSGEIAANEQDGILYYGSGDNGSGQATAKIAVAGAAKQDASTNLTAFSGLTGAADRVPYFTGAGALALTTLTAFIRSLMNSADAPAARSTLGLGSAATATLTTSTTDSTSGRVMRVSDFGIGEVAQPLSVFANNLDWAKPAGWRGFVNLGGSVKTPDGLTGGYICYEVIARRDNNNGYTGIATRYDTGDTWIAYCPVGADGPTWQKLTDTGDVSLAVLNIAALKTLPKTNRIAAQVLGYNSPNDGGGGSYYLDANDTSTADDGGTVIVAADGGRWKLVHDGSVAVAQFGTLAQALASGVKELVINRDLAVGANTTFPAGKEYRVRNGARITVASGFTLTIRGVFRAGYSQVFNGAGSVVGIREVWPEWWGAAANGTTPCRTALQAAHDCAEQSKGSDGTGRPRMMLSAGTYLLDGGLVWRPTANFSLEVAGCGILLDGTRFQTSDSYVNSTGPAILVDGNTDGTLQIADFWFHDFGLSPKTAGVGATRGLQFGSATATKKLIGLQNSRVENVWCSQFPESWAFIHCRLITFDRCSSWNDGITTKASVNWTFYAEGGFTGDLTFRDCQTINVASGNATKCIYIKCDFGAQDAANGKNQVAGIFFDRQVIYPADIQVHLRAGAGAIVSDIVFNMPQWDGTSTQMILGETNGSGSILRTIKLTGTPYMAGANKSQATNGIQFINASGNTIKDIDLDHPFVAGAAGKAVYMEGVDGAKVNSCTIFDCNNQGGPAIDFKACTGIQCNHNVASRSAGAFFGTLVRIQSDCNWIVAIGNNGNGIASVTAGVDDQTSASTKKQILGNL